MNKMTEPASLEIQCENSRDFLQTATGQFRTGDVAAGIESLINAMEKLENEVEIDRISRQPQIDLKQLLPAMRKLYFYIKNQDITGIADLLEDTFFPLAEEWLKGSEDA